VATRRRQRTVRGGKPQGLQSRRQIHGRLDEHELPLGMARGDGRASAHQEDSAVLGSSFYSAQVDIGGTFNVVGRGDSDGLITAEIDFTGLYDSSLAAAWKAVVVNSVAALV